MKTIMRGLTLAAVLLTGAAAQAEFVVDDFSFSLGGATPNSGLPTTPPVSSVSRVYFESTSNMTGTASAGSFAINFGSVAGAPNTTAIPSRTGGLAYTFATPADLHSSSLAGLLKFGFSASAGQVFDLLLTASTTVSGEDAFFTVSGLSGSGNIAINGSQWGNGYILSNVKTLQFAVTPVNPINGSSFTFGSVTAVPEPATMSLLGLTAIGGIFAHRRRKNQLAA